MKPSKEKFLLFIFTLIAFLPLAFLISWPSPKLNLIACNVGQGDAILLTKGFNQVLIDGGPDNKVLNCLSKNMPFWDKTIELIINTHPDKDHLAGLVDVIQSYNVNHFVSNGLEPETEIFKKFQQELSQNKIKVSKLKKGSKIKIAGLEFKTLWPSAQVLGASTSNQSTNDFSLVMHLKHGNFDALLIGDITSKVESQLIKENNFSGIEVLKVAHHGSKYSSSQEFLKAVKPEYAIISVGKNPWGHPTKEVLERLHSIKAKILRTDQQEVKLKI